MKLLINRMLKVLTIRRTLILYTSVIVVMSGSLIILLSHFSGRKAISSITAALLDNSMDSIQDRLIELTSSCRSVSNYTTIAFEEGYISTSGDIISGRRLLKHFSAIPNDYIDAIYLGDSSGKFLGIDRKSSGSEPYIGRSNRSTGGRMTYYSINPDGSRGPATGRKSDSYDPRTRPWYTAVAASGDALWTMPYRDWVSNKVTITLSRPIFSSDRRIRAVCGVDIFLDSIEFFLREIAISPGSIIFITESDGSLIASSTGTAILTSHTDNRIKAQESSNLIIRGIFNTSLGDDVNGNKAQAGLVFTLTAEGVRYLAGMRKFNRENGIDWTIYTAVPENDYLGQFRIVTRLAVIMAIFILAGALVLTYRISDRLTRPLKMLARSARRLSQGRITHPVPETGPAEILILSKSFNRMSSDLNYTIQHLEDMVHERTSELSDSLERERKFNEMNRLLVKNLTAGDMELTIISGIAELINADIFELAIPETAPGEYRYFVNYGGTVQFTRVDDTDEMPVQMKFPLPAQDGSEGYILFARSNEYDPFTGSDRIFAESVCNIANIALENTRLFNTISRLADTDSLTGLNNRQHVDSLAAHSFAAAARYGQELSVIMFDIDNFKRVNDTYGHDAGDRILRMTADSAKTGLRNSDIIGRYGGEEFLVILPSTGIESALDISERIRSGIEKSRALCSHIEVSVTVSLGVSSIIHGEDRGIEDIIKRADTALYMAKNSGRNRTSHI